MDLSSEITGPISVKFYMQPSDEVGKQVSIYSLDHMTMVHTMPIYM